jgi:hypothetical protein
MQQAIYDERALSLEELSEGSQGYRLPKGDWSLSVIDAAGNRKKSATVIEVLNPGDVGIISRMFPDVVRRETRVDHTYQGVRIGSIGKVRDFEGGEWAKMAAPGIEGKVDDRTYEITDDQIVAVSDIIKVKAPVYEMSDFRKTSPFNQVDLYEELFRENRQLLGMSIDRYTRKLKNGETREEQRYRQKKADGAPGGWVSKEYVFRVFDALKEYRTLVEKDDLSSLRKARALAKQYFTKQAYLEASARLHQKVYDSLLAKGGINDVEVAGKYAERFMSGEQLKKASDVADFLTLKCAVDFSERLRRYEIEDPATAAKAYSRLIRSGETENIGRALEIAKMYLSDDVVKKTQKFQERVARINQRAATSPGMRIGKDEVTARVNVRDILDRVSSVKGMNCMQGHPAYTGAAY